MFIIRIKSNNGLSELGSWSLVIHSKSALFSQECKCTCVASVVHGDVAEQIGHGLSVVDAPDGLGQDHTHVDSFDFGTLQLLHLMRNSVGHHYLEA